MLKAKKLRGGLSYGYLFFAILIFASSIFSNCARKKEKEKNQLVVIKDEFEKVEEFVLDEKTGQELAKNQILIYIVGNSKSDVENKKSKVSQIITARKGEFSILGEIEFLSEKEKVGVLLQAKVPAQTPEEIKQIVSELRNFDVSIRAFPNMKMKPSAILGGYVPLDPLFDSWDETPGGNNWHFEAVNMPKLWNLETRGKVPVAVIEFGIKKHEDLEYDLRRGVDGEGADLAQNHGVSVLGVLGAIGNNSKGIAGTIWRGDIKAYVIDGALSSLVQSIVLALQDKAKVILFAGGLGWGSISPEGNPEAGAILEYHREIFSVVFQYVRYYDALFVQSAGNEGRDAKWVGVGASVKDLFPQNILLVGSVDITGRISTFSNRGSLVDLYLPGESIFTTCTGEGESSNYGSYCVVRGTSYSAALGAGVAVLLRSINQNLKAGDIKELILKGVRVEGEGDNARYVIDFSISGNLARVAKPSEYEEISEPLPELPPIEDRRGGYLEPKSVEGAVYDSTYRAPKCPTDVLGCSTYGLVDGNDNAVGYEEPNQPNTLHDSCSDRAGTGTNAGVRIISIQVESLAESGFIESGPNNTDRRNIKVTVRAWCSDISRNTNQRIEVFYTQNADANPPTFTYIGSYRCDCGGRNGFNNPPVLNRFCSISGNEVSVSFIMTLPAVSPNTNMAIRARIQNSGNVQNVACYTSSAAGAIYDHDDLVFTVQNPPSSFTCGVYNSSFKAPVCYGDGWCGTCDTVICRDTVNDPRESPPGFIYCTNGGHEPYQPNTLFSQCPDGTDGSNNNSLDEQIRRINIKSLAPSGKFEGGENVEILWLLACDRGTSNDEIILAYASGVTYSPSPITNWRYLATVKCPEAGGVREYWYNMSYVLRLDNVEGWHAVRVVVGRNPSTTPVTGDICPSSYTFRDADDFVFYVKAKPPSSLPVCATYDDTTADGDPAYMTPKCPAGTGACSTCDLIKSRDNLSGTAESGQPNTLFGSCPDDGPATPGYLQTESIERIEIRDLSGTGTFQPGGQVEVSVLVYCDPVHPNYLNDYLVLLYSPNADSPTFTRVLTTTCSSSGFNLLIRTTITLANQPGKHVIRAMFQQGAFLPGEICAGGGSGQDGDTDDLVFVVGVPQAPSDFKAEGVAPDAITLSWSDVQYEDNYELRWTDTFDPDFSKWNSHPASPLSANTTWYLDRPLPEGTYRCYALRACNGNGCSDFAWSCATISSVGANCAVYDSTWKVPKCPEGVNNCSTCDLVMSRDSLPRRQEINTPNAWYSSSCLDGTGGDWYSSRSIERITLSTDRPSFQEGSTIVVTVRVFCSSTGDYVHLLTSGISTISWNAVGSQACSGSNRVEDKTFTFTPNFATWYVIRAVVSGSSSPPLPSGCPGGSYDEVDDIAVRVGGVPPVPSVFNVIFVPPDIARVVWEDVSNPDEDYYQLVSAPSPSGPFTEDTPHSPFPANTTQHDHAGLQPGQTLCFKLRACNSVGCSAFTVPRCVTVAPNPPSSLEPITAYSTEAMGANAKYVVRFQDASDNEDGFAIEWTQDGISWTRYEWWSDSTTQTGTGLRTIEFSLPGDVRWCFRVASFKLNAGGSLTLSSWVGPKCGRGLKAPSYFNVDSAPNIRVMRFFWQDNSSYEAGQNFEWRLQSSSAYTQESVLGLEYYEKEFAEENVYCARITNWWNGNNSIPEEQGSYSVGYSSEKCFVAMASPSPLIAEVINIGISDAIKLTWQDSSTQETGFRIEVNTGSGWGLLTTKAPNSTTHVHSSGLVAGTTYCYRVRAERTGFGSSPWSNSTCVRFGSPACSTIWDKDLSGSITTSAVIDDENIYVGTSTGYLISVDVMTGQIRWLKDLGSAVSSHLCAIQEGQRTTIFVGTVDGKFHAVDSDGNLIQIRDLGGVVGGCAVKDDKVYLGTTTGWVFVMSKTLSILNSKQVLGAISTAPAIDATRGSVYFVTEGGKVYAFSLDLSDKWDITISAVIKSSPGLGPKGDIYFGADDWKLYKVSATGTIVYDTGTIIGSAIRSSPVVYTYGAQVTVVVGAENGSVYAIKEDITGTTPSLLWSYSTGSAVKSTSALSQKSVFAGSGSTLYSISIGGGSLSCSVAVLGSITAPVKMKGQIVFLGTGGGRLYAISSVEPQSSYSWGDFGNGNGRVLDAHPYRGFAVEKSLWPVNVGAGILVSPKLYDFDGDGKLEIVVATGSGEVYVLNSTGTVRWSYSTGSVVWGSPAIGDIDGDGSAEIVVANDGGLVYAFDSAGNVKPGFPISVTCRIRFLTLANIDSDPENEILFPNFESCNRLYVYDGKDSNGDGVADLKWYYQLSQRIRSHAVVNGSGASAEILIADVVGNVYKFDSSGNIIWTKYVGLSQWMSSPSIGDIDGNGVQDFVVGGGGTGPNKIYAYDLNGNSKWSLVLPDGSGNNLSGYYPRNIVLANIDGDSGLEVIVTAIPFNFGDPGYIYVIDDNGVMIWFRKFSSMPSFAPAVGDFDYDGSQEIVLATDGGWLHIFDALSGEYEYGSPYFLGTGLRGPSPVFGDIDGNGRLELVFGDLSGYVRVFELGKGTVNGRKEWYFRKNGRNNANYNE